jgi:hypothetical protein
MEWKEVFMYEEHCTGMQRAFKAFCKKSWGIPSIQRGRIEIFKSKFKSYRSRVPDRRVLE